jgi:ElaB/YqjD/DUF883 family membrane-anchored ribosome-binding protein
MSNVTTPRKEMQTAGEKLQQAGSHIGQAAQEATQAAGQKAQDFVSTAGQKAQDLAHTAGQKVQEAAHVAGQKAEDATASLGSGLQTAADKVRGAGPHEGMLGRATEAVAGVLDQGGKYLEQKHLTGMANDVTEVIKRNPIPAVLIAVGFGYLLGRTLRS